MLLARQVSADTVGRLLRIAVLVQGSCCEMSTLYTQSVTCRASQCSQGAEQAVRV